MNTRQIAAKVLTSVIIHRRSLTGTVQAELSNITGAKDRAFIKSLCYGVIRWYFRLQFILDSLLQRPFKAKDDDIRILALLGLYQLAFTHVKPYAAVCETVACASKKPWAKSVLNGLLRNYQRNKLQIDERVDPDRMAQTAHPEWLLDCLISDWPDNIDQIITANNTQAPMVLRVNLSKIDRLNFMEELLNTGVSVKTIAVCDSGICLDQATDVASLPGFSEGLVSVQDGAAQLAAFILDAGPGDRVLDLCAAPGGKTVHILEHCPTIEEIVAVDIDSERLNRVRENLHRAGSRAALVAADATTPANWWDGGQFDRILLDAPCSAVGVIRRHPDIKLLRRPSDIDNLIILQKRLLDAVWPLLKTNGILLYATCSILKRENELRMMAFLETHEDAEEYPIEADWGVVQRCGRQILPGEASMDGFYYARIRKCG